MHSRANCQGTHCNATNSSSTRKQQLPVLTALQPSSSFARYGRNSTPNPYPIGHLHQFGSGCSIQPTLLDWSTVPSSLSSLTEMHQHLDTRFQSLMGSTYHRSSYKAPRFDDSMKTYREADPSSSLRGFGNEIAALTQTLNQLKSVEDRQNRQLMVMNKSGSFEKQGKLLATDFDDYNLILKLLKSIDDKRIQLLETMNRLEIGDNEQNKLLTIVDELKLVGDRLKEGILTITEGGCSTATP